MSSDKANKRKRSAGYYLKSAKQHKCGHRRYLEKGMKGFMVTCNFKEREATSEAYALLNEYANELYGPEFDKPETEVAVQKSDEEEEDIDKALQREVKEIKSVAKSDVRRFQHVDSGAANVLFIRTTLDSPNELFENIVSDLYEKKQGKSRHIMRMFPVAGTCKVQTFADEIEPILSPFFGGSKGHSFYLKIKIRNNSDVGLKNACFERFCNVIKGMNRENSPNYNVYDYIVQIDVIKTVMCISVLKDFKKYNQYNLQSLTSLPNISKEEQKNLEIEDKKETEKTEESNEKVNLGNVNPERIEVDTLNSDSNVLQKEGIEMESASAKAVAEGISGASEKVAVNIKECSEGVENESGPATGSNNRNGTEKDDQTEDVQEETAKETG